MKMKGSEKTCFLLFVTLAFAQAVPINNTRTRIQTDQSTKDLISEMVLLSKNLKTDVDNTIGKINGRRWPGQIYDDTDYPPFVSLSHQPSDNMPTRLNVSHCILKSFLPLLHCTITEFSAVPNTRGIVHKLKDLRWDSKNLIRHFREARNTLQLPQPANQTTDSMCVTPSCNVRSQIALGKVVSRGKAILKELQGKLLYEVYPDLKNTNSQISP